MSIKFNDTQLVLLSAAAQRDDHCLVPPAGAKRGHAQKAVAKLLEAGLLKEIRARERRSGGATTNASPIFSRKPPLRFAASRLGLAFKEFCERLFRMAMLALGLVIFLGLHSTRIFAEDLRAKRSRR